MPVTKMESSRTHSRESSFVSLLSGWMQQGVESFFATQRILVDLAMRQNASVMKVLRDRLTDPHHSPTTIMTELAGEGVHNFIEAQKVLLDLAQKQNEIVMSGVKEQIGQTAAAGAMTDLMRRSVDTFIEMQHDFLKTASKQTHAWIESTKAGKPFCSEHLMDTAREGMEHFINAQKQFLDVVADETAKATGKHPGGMKKMKKMELSELAREATGSFVDAQKKLFDIAGKQLNFNMKAASRAADMVKPFPFVSLADLTKEGVKSYVEAQKALMDVMLKPHNGHKHPPKVEHKKRPARKHPVAAAAV